MTDLRTQVDSAVSQLYSVWQRLSGRSGTLLVPEACYVRWQNLAALHTILNATAPLFTTRDNAWKVIEGLVDPKRIEAERNANSTARSEPGAEKTYDFSHDGVRMDFSNARHLALVSYISVTWSIYDRLANICGRLAATEEVTQHYKQNPKLVEHLLARAKERSDHVEGAPPESKQSRSGRHDYGSQLFAFSMQYHLNSAYDWPARVSYSIRNWLVHEGHSMGNLRLFHSDNIEDRLRLHGDAVSHIEQLCGFSKDANGNPKRCCLRDQDNPWRDGNDKDLLEVLRAYNGEVDQMFAGLLKWSVDSFVAQFVTFSERDKAVLSAVLP